MISAGEATGREPRLLAFYGAVAVAFTILVGQLWYVQIASGAQYRQRAEVNRIRVVSEKPLRGVVYDRTGRQLVRNVPSFTASIRPADLPRDQAEQAAVFARLGQIIDVPVEAIQQIVREARRDPFAPVRIKAPISRDQALILEEQHIRLPGVVVQDPPIRGYPEGALLGHVLGYIGPLPSRLLDSLLAQGYERDDSIGIAGIEAAFEEELRGTRGRSQVEVDAMGGITRKLATLVPATPGGNLVLTIDAALQRQAAEILAAAMAKGKSGQASLVAIQPQTGEILAMVSLPQYDNNLFAAGISQADYQRLSDDRWRPLVDHAVAGQYTPGSTFKLVTASAALQERVVTLQTPVFCPGFITVAGSTFRDWRADGHGNVTARQAVAYSCNIFFYSVAGGNPYSGLQGLRIDRLAEYARAFGFGEKTGLRLPGEAAGLVPSREWKRERKQEPWYIGDDFNTGIGQGDVLATPLQLANMVAVVANGGTLYRPRLVSAVRDAEDNDIQTFPAEVIRKVPVAPEFLAAIRAGMRDAVATPEGTAYWSLRQPSLSIAGKTGSAEFFGPQDSNGNWPTHALFVGFAPYEAPQIAVAVIVYGGGEGSEVAAPAAADVMKAYMALVRP